MKIKLLFLLTILAFVINYAQDSTALEAKKRVPSARSTYGLISTPSGSNLRYNGSWTIEAWVKTTTGGSQQYILETYSTSYRGGFALRLSNRNIEALHINNSRNSVSTTSYRNSTLFMNQWHHVAATFDDATNILRVYLDGLDVGSAVSTLNSYNTNSSIRIGARGDDANVSGVLIIDEIRIWNTNLSQSTINANKSACLMGNESGLLAWYDFEGDTNSTITDKSIHANNGSYVFKDSTSLVDGVYDCNRNGVSINEQRNNIELLLYPNPSSNFIQIKTSARVQSLVVFDVTGKIVSHTFTDKKQINITSLNSGVYFIKIQTNEGLVQKKFIKQ